MSDRDSSGLMMLKHGFSVVAATSVTQPFSASAEFWSPPVWRQLSAGAAATARRLADSHEHVAVIAVDTRWPAPWSCLSTVTTL